MSIMDAQWHTKSLIERAQAGDRGAFDILIQEYRPGLEVLVHSRLGVRLEARVSVGDVIQETFLHACKSIQSFHWQGEESFRKWLGGIAENVLRRESRRQEQARRICLKPKTVEQVSPSKAMRRDERFDRLQSALTRLSADHREVILLSRIEGLRVREIARRMNRSEGAVKNLLVRAIRELKAAFGTTESLQLPHRRLRREEVDDA
jgi:RNA polymerase sigma-70 factor (ECF subfamily)